jgi:membrane dipeptidase
MNLNVEEIHKRSIVIDGLNISIWNRELFEGLRRGGVTAVNATTAIYEGFRDAIRNIEEWNKKFDAYSDLIMPIKNVENIREAKEQDRVGVIIGFQNTSPIEDDLNLLQIFRDLGVRIMQLTYNDRNYSGDGCFERLDCGLSEFGIRVVEEMNKQGILIDLSHTGQKTTKETIEASRDPVSFTHANPKTIFESPRNKTDPEIMALAEKGGVIGATAYPTLLPKGYKSKLSDLLDVIDYLVSGPRWEGLQR